MWGPPTPPVDDSDIYIDHTLSFLYEPTVMSEAQLPPVHVRKERKRARVEPSCEGKLSLSRILLFCREVISMLKNILRERIGYGT